MTKLSTIGAAVATGIVLELGVAALATEREAWDSAIFWVAGLPLSILAAFFIGRRSRGNDWLWAGLIAPAHVLTMMIRNREIGAFWPLTIVFSVVLSAPFIVSALIGSRFRLAPPRP